jgi:hypothetical protein
MAGMTRKLTVMRGLFLTVNEDGILHNLKVKCHILVIIYVVAVIQSCTFLHLISHLASLHPRSAQSLDYTVTVNTNVGKTLGCYY